MRIILGVMGIALTAIGLFLPPIQALLPKLSPYPYYRQLLVRRSFYATGALFVFVSALYGLYLSTWITLVITAALILIGELLLVPRKVIPPLDQPFSRIIKPDDFPENAVVVGIELEGRSRAYPLSILTPHHIVNDSLGETPVAATYCPACRSGYIYSPLVRGMRLTFEPVSVRRRNMVMRDRETGSVWQHETGICLMGKFKGEQLRILDSGMCNWRTWVHEHPGTTICLRPENYRHPSPLGRIFGKLLDRGPEHIVGPGLNGLDRRLGQHDFIVGVIVAGIPKAYPLGKLIEKGMITDNIGGVPVALVYEEKADRVRAFKKPGKGRQALQEPGNGSENWFAGKPEQGESIPVVRQWWLAWSEYHPGSELFD